MEHSFDTDLAAEIGIEEAIIFEHICFWIIKNEANEKNQFDGDTWTFNSVKAFNEIFYYMSPKTIRNALKNLEEIGLIKTGNYNEIPFDRTKWYALTEKGKTFCERRNYDLPKRANGDAQKGKPIPYINNTDTLNNLDSVDNIHSLNNKNTNTLGHPEDDNFERLWKLYPKKKGKGQVSRTQKKKLYRIGFEVLSTCIERYSKEFTEGGKDMQYMMYGSTFFNSGYIDYLDENYLSPHANVETSTYTGDSAAGGWES